MGTIYQQLSCEERTLIQYLLEQGSTLRAIARSVVRAPSTISRYSAVANIGNRWGLEK